VNDTDREESEQTKDKEERLRKATTLLAKTLLTDNFDPIF